MLYVKAGAEARFAAEVDAARTQGASVIRAEDEVLARMAGSEARHQGLVAIRAEVPVATLRNMPYAYPTFHRAIEDALKDLNRAEGLRPS